MRPFATFFSQSSATLRGVRQVLSVTTKKITPTARLFSTDISESKPNTTIKPPRLPLLNAIADAAVKHGFPSLEKTLVVGTQPLLLTTASMFDVMFDTLKQRPENTIIVGKPYSANDQVVNYLKGRGVHVDTIPFPKIPGGYQHLKQDTLERAWELARHLAKARKIERIIILDEGGGWTESKPPQINYEIATWGAIEQTRYGLYNPIIDAQPYRLVNVAQSATKALGESPLIAETIANKLDSLISEIQLLTDNVCGVIGNGAIGSAIAKHLLKLGYKTIVYDEHENAFDNLGHVNCYRAESIKWLIANTNCIFGCTGRDIFKGLNVREIVRLPKTFVSCSSEDVEFLSLLEELARQKVRQEPFQTINCHSLTGHSIRLVRGGYPFNFDGSLYSMTAEDSTFTLGLMLGGFIQSRMSMQTLVQNTSSISRGGIDMLDPIIQKTVFELFVKANPKRFPLELIKCFEDTEWIKNNSRGEYRINPWIQTCFKSIDISSIQTPKPVLG